MNSILIHCALVSAAFAITIAGRVALHEQHSYERQRIKEAGKDRRVSEMIASWNSLHYTDLQQVIVTGAINSRIQRIPLYLSEIQRDRLSAKFSRALAYLNDPTVEKYLDLKTSGLTFHLERTPLLNLVLGTLNDHQEEIPVSFAHTSMIRVWALMLQKDWKSIPPRLTSICLPSLRVALHSEDSAEAVLGGSASRTGTKAQLSPDSGFRYANSLHLGAPPSYLVMSFYATSNASRNAGPVHLSLYWSSKDSDWAISKLFTDVSLNANLLF